MENQASPRKGKRGLRRIFNAFNYSLEGLGSALKHEYAFRQEVILVAILLPLSLVFKISLVEHLILAASLILVLILELINSAIEAVVDDHSLRDRPLAKRAKDIGSAAVLLGLLNALACWTAILAVNWNQLL
jgi:diacylglycerol kinase (ATP)